MTDDSSLVRGLAELFEATGHAHHQAFIDTGGKDAEWPLWYADYLHDRIGTLVRKTLTRSELVHFLVTAEKERAAKAANSGWQDFYAHLFLERYL